jgi:hypothetical protein
VRSVVEVVDWGWVPRLMGGLVVGLRFLTAGGVGFEGVLLLWCLVLDGGVCWQCLVAVFGGSVCWQCLLAVFGKGEAQPQSVGECMS